MIGLPVAEVPAIPAVGAIAGYLTSLLVFCLAVALTIIWVNILRGPLVKLAGIGFLGVHPFRWLGTVVNNVDHWLKAAEQGGERGMTWSLQTLMWSFSTTAKLTADLAQATLQFRDRVMHLTSTHVGANTGQSISPRIKTLEREYKGIDHRVDELEKREHAKRAAGAAAGAQDTSKLWHGIDDLGHRIKVVERELHGIEQGQTHTGAKAKPGEVAVPRTAPRVVPKTRAPAHHWTDILTKTAAATLVGAALTRLGLKWVRCPNVGKFGKWLCGSPGSLMDALLAGLTLVIATEGLVPFARQVEGIFGSATGFVRSFWHVNVIGPGGDRVIGENQLRSLD